MSKPSDAQFPDRRTLPAKRARAKAALGPRFDLRRFHEEILRDGSMPLDILEAKLDRWIAHETGAAPAPAAAP